MRNGGFWPDAAIAREFRFRLASLLLPPVPGEQLHQRIEERENGWGESCANASRLEAPCA